MEGLCGGVVEDVDSDEVAFGVETVFEDDRVVFAEDPEPFAEFL